MAEKAETPQAKLFRDVVEMSNTSVYGERKSWRQASSSGGNRWLGRTVLTLLAISLIALFIYIIFRSRPDRHLRTILLQAGSYDSEVIMPPMFAASASDRIVSDLGAISIQGTTASIRKELADTTSIKQFLEDPDDTVLVIVRGYLLSGSSPDGVGREPMIACSDLGPGAEGLSGMLPLRELLQPLATNTPSSFSGTRIVVLDIEPPTALHRLNHYGDEAIDLLDQTLARLEGPHVDRLWVMVTRGPLQNAGWDPVSKMPVSTETLVDALTGAANINNDYEIRLDELCRYIAARYERLAQRRDETPKLTLLRGGVGRITKDSDVESVWIAKSKPVETTDQEAPEPARTEPQTDDDAKQTASANRSVLRLTPVRYQVTSAEEEALSAGESPEQASEQAPEQASDPAALSPTADSPEVPLANQAQSQPLSQPSFWELRDQIELYASSDQLNPIATAPQLWRKLIRQVLHAEIESYDPQSEISRTQIIGTATSDLQQLLSTLQSADRSVDANRFSPGLVREMVVRWNNARRVIGVIDPQVREANQLQQLIAIGHLRLYSRLRYREQAMLAASDPLSDDDRWREKLVEAERLLAEQQGNQVDRQRMQELNQQLQSMVMLSDQAVDASLVKLLDELSIADETKSWSTVRRAHAWLRSPLPNGRRRQALKAAVESAKSPQGLSSTALQTMVAFDLAGPTSENYQSSQQLKLLEQDFSKLASIDRFPETKTASESRFTVLKSKLRSGTAPFADHFAAALRIDPYDTNAEDLLSPILHAVTAVPRVRNLETAFFDSSDRRIPGDQLTLKATTDFVWVKVHPDSDRATQFQITVRQPLATQSGFETPPFETRWQGAVGVQPTANPETVLLTVPPREIGQLRLDLRALQQRDKASIVVLVKPMEQQSDPRLTELATTKTIELKLPKPDQFRVAVRTTGLTREVISDDDTLPGGVWLRSFASRKTSFSLSLFNESGRPTRVRLWLLRLNDPFRNQQINAYWPDVITSSIDAMRTQMLDADGRVRENLLAGDQLLKGPTELTLEAARKRTPISWKSAEAEASEDSSPTPDDAASANPQLDVSHGLAIVARQLDQFGNATPANDEIIWLIPKPWSPESYLEIPSIRYEDGEVKLTTRLKERIDGDNLPDRIPEIETSPVTVSWIQDDQWDRTERNSTNKLLSQTVTLRPDLPARPMQVIVPNRQETVVRLDVDGWPRAMRRLVLHRDLVEAIQPTRWDTIDFSSISIDYGDQPTSSNPDDLPLQQATVYFPSEVVFRGGAESLATRIHADLSPGLYSGASPPEIRLLVDNQVQRRYWTDRRVRSIASNLGDSGEIELLTTVQDLEEEWTTEASRTDGRIKYQAELVIGNDKRTALMELVLDSTPPTVDRLRRSKLGTVYVGDSVTWDIEYSDPQRNGVSSGIERLVIGVDQNGDKKPDSTDLAFRPAESANLSAIPESLRTFTPEKAGRFRIAAQVWDAVGLASQGVGDEIDVKVRPKPQVTPNMDSAPKSGSAPVTSVPERGRIRGRIELGSTMRGKLTLSPAPDKIRPGDTIEIGSSNPPFDFSNVPAGEYTLTFQGTANNAFRTYVWSNIKIDIAGGKPFLSLSPANAESK